MRKSFMVLIAIGLSAVALAIVARQRLPRFADSGSLPAPGALPAGAREPAPAPPPAAPSPAVEVASGPASGAPAEQAGAGAAAGDRERVRLGGWVKDTPLPLCGRSNDVTLRDAPDGKALGAQLPSCQAAYSDFPSGDRVPILARKGEWIQLPSGWASIKEVRSAETLIVEGVEYWHDLFNTSIGEVERHQVTVKGDTDPCAGQICGNAHGLWEEQQQQRERLAGAFPDGQIPPEEEQALQQRFEEMNAAAEKEHEEANRAAEERTREERTFEVAEPPAPGRKVEPRVEGGGYMCCT